ncbi:phage tail tape measure protein [Anaerotignum lactatifermentans]|uniref:phage tail tape measure protein n=1 Tax=Anaerotignum lactatifermentans TaxID=160404 RepID=UPI00174E4E81|nr:phage tail tape measure protein [Anaerotignum lactatifermentans]HJE92584.1 phage tail tape measure protein [Anaerotignum lactatifermentans]
MAKNKIMTTIVNMAGNVDPSVQKAFREVESRLEGMNGKAIAVGASVAAVGAGITVGAVHAGKALINMGDAYNSTMGDLQAKTGATAAEMEGLSDAVEGVYADRNLGTDMQDVADAVALAKQTTGLWGEDLESVSADALMLRDTFDYDLNESLRASKALMTNFGLDSHTAMNYIAEGAQKGLDYSGELLDTISEYSVQFAKVGLDADDMFNIMQAGAENGAWNLDKVGDAIKEFSIRSIDGSKTTQEAFAALGYDADEVMGIFAKGGEDANIAFNTILQDLISMDDKVARDAVGVQLFGTMWEDLGVDAMAALSEVTDGTYLAGDALNEINAVKYDTVGQALQGISRQLEVQLAPAGSAAAQRLAEMSPQITESLKTVSPYIEDLAVKFSDVLVDGIDLAIAALIWCSQNTDTLKAAAVGLGIVFATFSAAKMITSIHNAVAAFSLLRAAHLKEKAETIYLQALYAKDAVVKGASTAATVAQTAATGAWNVVAGIGTAVTSAFGAAMAFLTSPIGLVILAIGALIGIGVLLYKNWDTVKMYAVQLGTFLSGVWNSISTAVGNFINGIKEKFLSGFSALVGIVKAPINGVISLINGAINGINGISLDIPDWVPGFGGKHFGLMLPTMPLLAKGGFTNGASIAGEAGTEAVISFDPSVRSQNLSYWAKAGQMLGALPEGVSVLESGGDSNSVSIGQIVFSPKIEITGNADKESIIAAIRAEYPEFIDLLERWFMERGYFAYES